MPGPVRPGLTMPLKPAAKVPDQDDLFCIVLGYLSRRSTRSCYRRLAEAAESGADREATVRDMGSKYGRANVEAAETVTGMALAQEEELHGGSAEAPAPDEEDLAPEEPPSPEETAEEAPPDD